MNKARFSFGLVDNGQRIHVIDHCNQYPDAMSVTNDAEAVILEVGARYPLAGKRVSYLDTMGQIDELCHDGEKFTGFKRGEPEWRR